MKQRGAGGAPGLPHSRVFSHTSWNGLSMTFATLATSPRPPSFWRSSAVRLMETTSAVRLRASGRPRASRIMPRDAGVMICRVAFSAAALR